MAVLPDLVLADAPLAYWRLNEPSGTVAADASGNGRAAAYGGTHTKNQAGPVWGDGALELNGGDVTCTTNTTGLPVGAGAFTIEAWVKISATTGVGLGATQGVVGWGNGTVSGQSNSLRVDASVTATGALSDFTIVSSAVVRHAFGSAGGAQLASPALKFLVGTWHQFAVTWNGTTRRLYVDGYQVATDTPTAPNVTLTAGGLRLGQTHPGSADGGLRGGLAHAAVFGTALSQARLRVHHDTTQPYEFGACNTTIDTNVPNRPATDYQAGMRLAYFDTPWRVYHTALNTFDAAWATDYAGKLNTAEAAGFRLMLGPALHYGPLWVRNLADGGYQNQFVNAATGANYVSRQTYESTSLSGLCNLAFSEAVRAQVRVFFAKLVETFGPVSRFWGVRLNGGGYFEWQYPNPSETNADNGTAYTNSFWAYNASAQSGGSNRPTTVAACPMPGWKPGDATWSAQSVTVAMTTAWYAWYLDALADSLNFQIDWWRNVAGYTGYLLVPGGGTGAKPTYLQDALNNRLSHGTDTVTGAGLAHHLIWPRIANKAGVLSYNSVLCDHPELDGSAGGNTPLAQAGDAALDPAASGNWTTFDGWSGTRWFTYVADRSGIEKHGENPGFPDMNRPGFSVPGASPASTNWTDANHLLKDCVAAVQQDSMRGMFWAHEHDLYRDFFGNTSPDNRMTLDAYGAAIHSLKGTLPPVELVIAGTGAAATANPNGTVTVTWTTSVAASSQVEYGLSAGPPYTWATTPDPTPTTAHSVVLSGLTASTAYHYRVISTVTR